MASYCICAPVAPLFFELNSLGRGWIEGLSPFPLSGLFSYGNSKTKEQRFLVTGSNRGVGYYTARILLQRGYSVSLLVRDQQRGEEAKNKLIKETGNLNCTIICVDLSDISSVQSCVELINRQNVPIRGIVNNAGLIGRNSIEANHIGHFVLTLGLLPSLKRGVVEFKRVYIINVASVAHLDGSVHLENNLEGMLSGVKSSDWDEYAGSKAANVLFGLAFQSRYTLSSLSKNSVEFQGISLYSYHPGVMLTDLWRGPGSTSVEQERSQECARTALCCCVKHPVVAAIGLSSLVDPTTFFRYCFDYVPENARTLCLGSPSGAYFQQSCCCCVAPLRASPLLYNQALQNKLWSTTESYITSKTTMFTKEENVTLELNDSSKNSQSSIYIHSSLPCTEFLTAAPYCVCCAILC